ncbi:MAG: thiol:disulfide interchange protein, partial [Myxococcota bacterium]
MAVAAALSCGAFVASACGPAEAPKPAKAAASKAGPAKVMAATSEAVADVVQVPVAPEVQILTIERTDDTPLSVRFKQVIAEGIATGRQTLVMFTADWCSPCRTIKELMHDSPKIRAAMAKAQLLIIDVDAWRGPAHRLIPGAVPNKLPLLVAVDADGKEIQQSYGTALGLLSEDTTAGNLARMLRGEPPERPAYMDDRDTQLK